MKTHLLVMSVSTMLFICGCQPQTSVCPPVEETTKYLATLPVDIDPVKTLAETAMPTRIPIGGKLTQVDRIVEGPLCNDHWGGVVYVSCGIQVAQWEEKPLFLKGCDLSIEPGTVVYVADHNDAAYYNGCSCHSGELP